MTTQKRNTKNLGLSSILTLILFFSASEVVSARAASGPVKKNVSAVCDFYLWYKYDKTYKYAGGAFVRIFQNDSEVGSDQWLKNLHVVATNHQQFAPLLDGSDDFLSDRFKVKCGKIEFEVKRNSLLSQPLTVEPGETRKGLIAFGSDEGVFDILHDTVKGGSLSEIRPYPYVQIQGTQVVGNKAILYSRNSKNPSKLEDYGCTVDGIEGTIIDFRCQRLPEGFSSGDPFFVDVGGQGQRNFVPGAVVSQIGCSDNTSRKSCFITASMVGTAPLQTPTTNKEMAPKK